MCFPKGNATPNCNTPFCSAWALGCYFLSYIHPELPCFPWASRVSPVSSGNFACVAVAAHSCAKGCGFRSCLDYWAAFRVWLQSCYLTSISPQQETVSGTTVSSFVPPVQERHQQNGARPSWQDVRKKVEILDLFSLEKAKGHFTGLFTWLKEVIGKMKPGSSQRCTMLGKEAKDTSYSKKKSSS